MPKYFKNATIKETHERLVAEGVTNQLTLYGLRRLCESGALGAARAGTGKNATWLINWNNLLQYLRSGQPVVAEQAREGAHIRRVTA